MLKHSSSVCPFIQCGCCSLFLISLGIQCHIVHRSNTHGYARFCCSFFSYLTFIAPLKKDKKTLYIYVQIFNFTFSVFKGCFVVHGYLTANRSQIWKDISIRSCMILCHQHGQPFAALHNGNQCACLTSLKHLVETSADKCNATCTVYDLEYCGGRYTASVYKVNPRAAVQSDQSSDDAQQKGNSSSCSMT